MFCIPSFRWVVNTRPYSCISREMFNPHILQVLLLLLIAQTCLYSCWFCSWFCFEKRRRDAFQENHNLSAKLYNILTPMSFFHFVYIYTLYTFIHTCIYILLWLTNICHNYVCFCCCYCVFYQTEQTYITHALLAQNKFLFDNCLFYFLKIIIYFLILFFGYGAKCSKSVSQHRTENIDPRVSLGLPPPPIPHPTPTSLFLPILSSSPQFCLPAFCHSTWLMHWRTVMHGITPKWKHVETKTCLVPFAWKRVD